VYLAGYGNCPTGGWTIAQGHTGVVQQIEIQNSIEIRMPTAKLAPRTERTNQSVVGNN
jgi:GH24 family phage-related lysozyme (muramidase)